MPRNLTLDILRISACFLVVLMHSPIPSENAVGPFLSILSYLTAPCIGLFFMVSGALLLPVKTDYLSFLKKRFSKIVVPTILWSLIYIALRLYYSESEIALWQQLCSLPFSPQGEGVLWFMYTLAGLYLLAPILSAWLEKATKKEMQFVLLLWGISLCYPILSFWVTVNESNTGILYYFTGYVGYFVLGYYLKKYPTSINLIYAIVIAVAGIATLGGLKYYGIEFDFYSLFWYLSIFIAAYAVAIWLIITKMKKINSIEGSLRNCIITISNISFGIYLIHILIMRRWLWHLDWILNIDSYIAQTFVVVILTFSISAIACIGISYIPGSQWLIGYHKR